MLITLLYGVQSSLVISPRQQMKSVKRLSGREWKLNTVIIHFTFIKFLITLWLRKIDLLFEQSEQTH